jgi:HlyD family type I secretion membrane fusion protein
MSFGSAGEHQWYATVPRKTGLPIFLGFLVIAVTVVGFGVWSATAMIAGAVMTTGAFVATGQNKIIQHLEGGVIQEIAVREGDIVEPTQLLVKLDETAAGAELRRLELRLVRLRAMDARLQAEMRETSEIAFPKDIVDRARENEVEMMLESERFTFEARYNSLESEVAGIQEGINALQERVAAAKLQMAGVQKQIALVQEEIQAKEYLLKGGLVRKPEVLSLQRIHANLEGEFGRLQGEMGDARERIARSVEQITGARKTAIKTAVEQLQTTRGELHDVSERINTAKGILSRVRVTAPVRGVVVKLRYHTPGGVVEAGKSIMELLPLNDDLVIETRVRPQDIDHVKRGQHATVRLTALNRRMTPMIAGEVIYVSADALPDERRSMQAVATSDGYIARIKLNAAEAQAIQDFKPIPGMPAEVHIKTGERTFFDYLTKPVRDSMARSFREY